MARVGVNLYPRFPYIIGYLLGIRLDLLVAPY